MKITHKQLTEIGAKWLLTHINYLFKCQFVVTEFRYLGAEEPDIFGLNGSSTTTLIEVKISRSDFLRDSKKDHRIKTEGLGHNKYYLCPDNLIKPDEIPENWGLLYFKDSSITVIKPSEYNKTPNIEAQQALMYSIIRRVAKHKHLNKHWMP